MYTAAAAGFGVAFIVLLLIIRWRWRALKSDGDCPPCTPVQLVHRLCPHHNVVQRFEVEQKDSLDDHLDVLTRKLAEKEGRLRLSKSKIRETQNEIDNLHAIDQDVRTKYREIMESLRTDLLGNEKECKRLQEQIEWVSRRRAELKEEISRMNAAYRNTAKNVHKHLTAELEQLDQLSASRTEAVRRGGGRTSQQPRGAAARQSSRTQSHR
ncbi:hypothetical protein O3G_MSEX007008 [Manduca sexta]|uniref:Uncharacterized protein n=1 Tax=Manduca sexta TaxID=7130 RepID=A0A921Z5K9_MANSE|nr:hypothetical protein O3G_MSEX007008 [Manduca sexta]